MEFLLFFLGPLLAFGLPLLLVIGSAFLGATASRNLATMLGLPILLSLCSALVVPAGARLSSTNEWPAPWWLAALLGSFKYEPLYLLMIAANAVSAFYLAALARFGIASVTAQFRK